MPSELQIFNLICLVESQAAQRLVNSFESLECELQNVKAFPKLLKSLQKKSVDAVFLEFSGKDYNELVIWSKEIKTESPKTKLVVALPGSMPLFPPQLDLNAIDLIISLDQGYETLRERLLQQWGFRRARQLEGRAQKMVDLFLERSQDWPKLGEIADVEEGMTMDHPEKNLRKQRQSDRDVLFLLNGQLKKYYIQGAPSFWTPDPDLVLRGPSKSVLTQKPRLMVHSSGPPLKAAIDREGRYFGRSSYAVIPKVDVEVEAICVYLNSRMVDFYFNKIFVAPESSRHQAGSYLRTLDLKELPIPKHFVNGILSPFRDRVLELEMLLNSGAGAKHVRVVELQKQLEAMIFDQFNFDSVDLHHLEKLHF